MQTLKKLKRKSYFVTEAIKIIEREGIGSLTARSVAEAAGFNPSSIYNYFENMDHLENTASIFFTEDYANDLASSAENVETGMEIYIIMWEIFLKHAFNSPNIFYNVFYSSIAQAGVYNLFKEYYVLFPEQYPSHRGFILGMMNIDKTQNRGKFVLEKCVKEGSLPQDMLNYVNDIHIGYTKFVITDIVKNKLYSPSHRLYHECVLYIMYSMIAYVPHEHKCILQKRIDFHKKADDAYSRYIE